jgi:hypothetical protein
LHGANAYLNYLKGKFQTIAANSSRPEVTAVRCNEFYIEIEFEQVIDGKKNISMLQFEIEKEKIIKGCMGHPSFRQIQ